MVDPMIPLSVSEMLHVAMSVAAQSASLDDRTKENIDLILRSYRCQRDRVAHAQGFTQEDVAEITAAAAEAMANWLDDRALRADLEDDVIKELERDFGECQAKDRDQGSSTRGREAGTGDNSVGGVDDSAPPGGGWDSSGGATDPGGQATS